MAACVDPIWSEAWEQLEWNQCMQLMSAICVAARRLRDRCMQVGQAAAGGSLEASGMGSGQWSTGLGGLVIHCPTSQACAHDFARSACMARQTVGCRWIAASSTSKTASMALYEFMVLCTFCFCLIAAAVERDSCVLQLSV